MEKLRVVLVSATVIRRKIKHLYDRCLQSISDNPSSPDPFYKKFTSRQVPPQKQGLPLGSVLLTKGPFLAPDVVGMGLPKRRSEVDPDRNTRPNH